jgi:hypothetical protein
MNDATCKARREFLGNRFVKGLLFDMTPEEETPDVDALVNLGCKASVAPMKGCGRRECEKERFAWGQGIRLKKPA